MQHIIESIRICLHNKRQCVWIEPDSEFFALYEVGYGEAMLFYRVPEVYSGKDPAATVPCDLIIVEKLDIIPGDAKYLGEVDSKFIFEVSEECNT